jgi:hypothetical protein
LHPLASPAKSETTKVIHDKVVNNKVFKDSHVDWVEKEVINLEQQELAIQK